MTDFAQRRIVMVDTQVRPNDVTKYPIIEAMLTVEREGFVPDDRRDVAYVGENISLGPGRSILEPRSLAKLLDAVDIGADDHVMIIGAGLGYSAAVAGHMARSVVAVEEDAALAGMARAALVHAGAANVEVVTAPLATGARDKGPFNVILVEGGVESVSDALARQLADGGRIGCIFMDGALGVARVGHASGGQVSWRFAFNATAPVLPGFTAARAFAL